MFVISNSIRIRGWDRCIMRWTGRGCTEVFFVGRVITDMVCEGEGRRRIFDSISQWGVDKDG
jgi:hypothetical protein